MKTGVLLVNLGTPRSFSKKDVKLFLREFLLDPLVIDIPYFFRWILVNCIIIPNRLTDVSGKYERIWTPLGSPLDVHSKELEKKFNLLRPNLVTKLAMRYGENSIEKKIAEFDSEEFEKVIVVPLFPHICEATTGAVENEVLRVGAKFQNIKFELIKGFCDHDGFIHPFVEITKAMKINKKLDFLVFSFHGMPEKSVLHQGIDYREECLRTAQALRNQLGWPAERMLVSFQSRLGKANWTKPYTNDALLELLRIGIKRVVVIAPSFVADCLETLEELDLELRKQFIDSGGESFKLIPSLNSSDAWVEGLGRIVDGRLGV